MVCLQSPLHWLCAPQYLPDNGRVGVGFCFHQRVAVHVHCGRDLGVPHQLLLHSHRGSRIVQPGTVGMAEGVPTNPVVLPGCCPALFMDRQATAVRNRAVLLTPDADASPALWTLHQAASRRTNVVLLDVRWLDDAQIRNGCRIAEFTFTIAPLTGSTLLEAASLPR